MIAALTPLVSRIARMAALLLICSVVGCSKAHAEGLKLGVHLASVHLPAKDGQNNDNVGLYVRTESGLTAGAYRNTLRRTSLYVGETFTLGPVDVLVGVASGYQRKCTDTLVQVGVTYGDPYPGRIPGPPQPVYENRHECTGFSRGWLTPVLAPSIALPFALLGSTPRLWCLYGAGKHSSVLHLSTEWSFWT